MVRGSNKKGQLRAIHAKRTIGGWEFERGKTTSDYIVQDKRIANKLVKRAKDWKRLPSQYEADILLAD